MASFNFIDAAGKGYKFVWDERAFLLRLAALPLLIKIASFMLIVSLDLQNNLLRQGLILLPSYFMEGWVAAHAIRLAIFGELGPLNDPAGKRVIMSSSILYALIKLGSSLLAGAMMNGEDVKRQLNPAEFDVNPGILFGMTFMLVFAFWAFRFFWLYVPMAMGCPLNVFLKKIEGFKISFYMLGVWMLTAIPPIMAMIFIANIMLALMPGATPDTPSPGYMYGLAALQAALEMLIALLSSAAMAFGVWSIFTNPTPQRR